MYRRDPERMALSLQPTASETLSCGRASLSSSWATYCVKSVTHNSTTTARDSPDIQNELKERQGYREGYIYIYGAQSVCVTLQNSSDHRIHLLLFSIRFSIIVRELSEHTKPQSGKHAHYEHSLQKSTYSTECLFLKDYNINRNTYKNQC
jgi:hypothetical protein